LGTDVDLLGPEGDAAAGRLPLAFLAVSYAADSEPAPGDPGGAARVRAAAAMLTDQAPQTAGDSMTVWVHGTKPWIWTQPDGGFTAMLSRSPRPRELSARLGSLLGKKRQHPMAIDPAVADLLCGITPPFAVVSCPGEDRPLIAATDVMGCRHLYWHQGDGWAALSTSALALACCASAAPDPDAVAVRAMLGFHVGARSPFIGVHKLGPAGLCTLSRGQVYVTEYADPWPEPSWPGSLPPPAHLARGIADLLRACGAWATEEFPNAVIELSGGLASRIQLAAIPPARRPRMQGVTFDAAGTRDSKIARQAASISGLNHHRVLSLAPLAELSPEQAWAIVRRSAIRDDCSANPVAHGALDWAEEQLGSLPRISGVGGETARGFYYLGGRLTSRLARWRLMTSEAVDPGCLGPDMAPWVRGRAIFEVRRALDGYQCDSMIATDEFSTRERVVRSAGLRLSSSSTERTVLASMLDPDFVALARAIPPSLKRNSRLLSMVLSELDPILARVPLESRHSPARLAGSAALGQARSYPAAGKKAAGRIPVLAAAGEPADGQAVLSQLVLEHWRREPHLLMAVPATGLADGAWLGRLLEGGCQADPATIGYLANLLVMTEMTAVDPELADSVWQARV
jgi:asparagine synthase (glutamine-hydrolysing)